MKYIYLIIGHLSLILGIIGIFLPVLPTTPFLILSAFMYSKSSPKLHSYLLNHKLIGPPLKDWEENRVISIKAKIIATIAIVAVIYFKILNLKVNLILKSLVIIILTTVLIYINTRKSHRI